ncbi:MAG TPA: hypothetical protein VKA89_08905 [Solirubrobacterales bacterium]|nr:hypothetical protein [Solirubrobacterales bacterium]
MSRTQKLLSVFFAAAGSLHFVVPRRYEAIVPPYVPRQRDAVRVSGAAEIAGAAMLIPRSSRRAARWWLIALLAAVFPANVHMALHPGEIRGLDPRRVPRWALWVRLPVQPLIGLWVWRATR